MSGGRLEIEVAPAGIVPPLEVPDAVHKEGDRRRSHGSSLLAGAARCNTIRPAPRPVGTRIWLMDYMGWI
jgi:hypothetical protein